MSLPTPRRVCMTEPTVAPRPVPPKTESELAAEWDRIAEDRNRQLSSGVDASFDYVLLPIIKELSADDDWSSVLDFGCGTGFLTARLAASARRLVGVDPSGASIAIARRNAANTSNVSFYHASLEDYAANTEGGLFSLCIANMTLMDVSTLTNALDAVRKLLRPGGAFVFTITHPWFWPLYWGYHEERWFHYDREIFIEASFQISGDARVGPVTTHVHRPLWRYTDALMNTGFSLEAVKEPLPSADAPETFRQRWAYPRFLAMRWLRKSDVDSTA
jgi:SAM-dependent methyltransferase